MTRVYESERVRGVFVVEPRVFADDRGVFVETYRREWIPGAREMIQSNRSTKAAGAVVGLHFHLHQADFWYVPSGRIRGVVHDLRVGSPTEGQTDVVELSGDNHRGMYVPPGVAHGFSALTDVVMTYLVDGYYNPADELGLAWDDPAVGADWGLAGLVPILSERDRANPGRDAIAAWQLPRWPLRTDGGQGEAGGS